MPRPSSAHRSEQAWGATSFVGRGAAKLAALWLSTVGFGVLLALVHTDSPVLAVDRYVAVALNNIVTSRPTAVAALEVVTVLGGSPTGWVVLSALTVGLVLRHQQRLAGFVAVTGLGAMVLSPVVKDLVGRLRPVVEAPVASAPGPSFPSGHALASVVTYGTLLLVLLPLLRRRARTPVVASTVLLVVAIGFTRLALGVHFLTDVLAGWLLGVAWLTITTAAFRVRRQAARLPAEGSDGLALDRAPDGGPPRRWVLVTELMVAWVLLLGLLLSAGWLVTQVLTETVIGRLDTSLPRWLAAHRTPAWTSAAQVANWFGSTPVVVTVAMAAATLVLVLTRQWRPVLFLAALMIGELTLFGAASTVVGRPRPPVYQLGLTVPPTASFPSGHVAAALTLYGGIAVVVWTWVRARWRWLVLAAASLAVGSVAAGRLYYGVHYPTDVAGSLLLAGCWLLATGYILRPATTTCPRRVA